jgi:hypothetical protein
MDQNEDGEKMGRRWRGGRRSREVEQSKVKHNY